MDKSLSFQHIAEHQQSCCKEGSRSKWIASSHPKKRAHSVNTEQEISATFDENVWSEG